MSQLFEAQTVPMTHDISLVYSNLAGDKVIEVLQNNPAIIRKTYGLEGVRGCANALLRELRCYASINSLAEVPLPNIERETPESDKIVAVNAFEWRTARFELVVFKRAKNSGEWAECGVTALKNSAGHRYRLHRILDLVTDDVGATVGEWGRIGVAVRAAGYGYPQSWDRISITGGWVQEFTWCQSRPTYVEVNNYGGAAPTPTPTPTPPPVPTLALSLASGSTTAIANNDSKITLTTTNIPTGTQLTGSWFKDAINTGVSETVTTTGNAIEISTLKLRDKLSGQYSLRLFYNDTGYLSNAVSVTVNPEIILSLPTGTTTAKTGEGTAISIEGKYFSTATPLTATWLKAGVATSATFNTQPVNGSFTGTQSASIFQTIQGSGTSNYRLSFQINGVTYLSNEIAVQFTQAPTATITPGDVAITNYYNYQVTVTLAQFTVGDVVTVTWLRNDVELTASASNKTISQNSGANYAFTIPAQSFGSAPYAGAGTYKVKVTKGSLTIYSNTINIRASDPQPSLG